MQTKEEIELKLKQLPEEAAHFGVTYLWRVVGFDHDEKIKELVMKQLREGQTVMIVKICEPRDLPENQIVGKQAKQFIN